MNFEDYLAYVVEQEDVDGFFFGDLYRSAVGGLGVPSDDEMFGFEPALALGGRAELECVKRLRMKPELSILAQLNGNLTSY